MRERRRHLRAFVLLAALAVAAAPAGVSAAGAGTSAYPPERLSRVRFPFIANAGQQDAAVAYYAPTFAGTAFVMHDGRIAYAFPAKQHIVETVVEGSTRPSAGERADTRVSYFVGSDATRWTSALPTYQSISLGEVWPRIRLELRASGANVEKRFAVDPGGDPSRIRMRVAGTKGLRVDDAGALVAATDAGDVTFTPPAAFQERSGVRRPLEVAYVLHGDREYGFRLRGYDSALPLVIDPLLQATYLGGNGIDAANGLAIDPVSGDVYAAGQAFSTNLPGTTGGAQSALGGKSDAFVARLNAALTTLEQVTYVGGTEDDQARAIAIHPTSGDIYIAGQATSTDFPATAGGAQPTNPGGLSTAAFVARLDATLTTLEQSTYFGGGVTVAYALAVDPASGDVYAGGSTIFSVLPGTTGGAQPANGGAQDGFVAHFNAALTTLDKATYLGGGGGETVHGLAIHPLSGDVYAVGDTSSTDFPGTTGGLQGSHGVDFGNSDAFVARLNSALTSIVQATYLGGNNQETAEAIAIHSTSGEVYVAGWTESTNFPGTSGGAQPTFPAGDSAFVARMNAGLTMLDQATYLGTAGVNRAFAIAIHPASSDVYVAGYSTGFLPGTAGGAQPTLGGFQDAFVTHFNAALTTIDQSTFLGGTGADMGQALAIHPASGDVYVAGSTQSNDFPGTGGGAQATHGVDSNNNDAFIARLTPDLAATGLADVTLSSLHVAVGALAPAFASSTVAYTDTVPFGVTSITVTPTLSDATASVTVNGDPVATGTASAPIDLSVGSNPIDVVVTAAGGTSTKTYTINVVRAAALFRAYLSGHGSDVNPCTLAKPCRLLPAALLAIDDGGEIWILDSANYNTAPVDVAKSATILAIPGAIGSIVASGGDAIDIDAPGVRVTLRNLVLLNLGGGLHGVSFTQGASLAVEGCEIYGMGDAAISATAANGAVAVTNSVVRDSATYGASLAGSVTATFDGVHLLNNALAGVFVGAGAQVTLSNSVVADNATFGVTVQATSGSTARATIEKSVLRANVGGGVEGFADGAGDHAEIALSRSSISHNGSGVSASTNAGGSVAVMLERVVVTENTTGVNIDGAGSSTVYSRQDNTVSANATDVSGGTLTTLPGK